jgi:hypothetical protein
MLWQQLRRTVLFTLQRQAEVKLQQEGDVIDSQLNIQFTNNAFRTITDDNVKSYSRFGLTLNASVQGPTG